MLKTLLKVNLSNSLKKNHLLISMKMTCNAVEDRNRIGNDNNEKNAKILIIDYLVVSTPKQCQGCCFKL